MSKIKRWLTRALSKRPVISNTDEAEEDFFDDKSLDINCSITLSGYGVDGLLLEKGVISVDEGGNIINPVQTTTRRNEEL